jgi:hypothetical protein
LVLSANALPKIATALIAASRVTLLFIVGSFVRFLRCMKQAIFILATKQYY